jgi:hypothetical protein
MPAAVTVSGNWFFLIFVVPAVLLLVAVPQPRHV